MRRAARGLATVGHNDHWQLAKHSIPPCESILAIRTLQDFLQDWRRKPHGLPVFEGRRPRLLGSSLATRHRWRNARRSAYRARALRAYLAAGAGIGNEDWLHGAGRMELQHG